MKIFIWSGDGISSAYNNDGTLVVLANTAEEARAIIREAQEASGKATREVRKAAIDRGYSESYNWQMADSEGFAKYFTEMHEKYPQVPGGEWDGTDEALNREPDEVIELDKPKFIAFNGGDYN